MLSTTVKKRIFRTPYRPCVAVLGKPIRIKSGEPGFLGFSVPGRLGGVICKPEGVA